MCQILEHQSPKATLAVYCYPRVMIFTKIEPSAAPSAARAHIESSKKRNATAKPASKPKRKSTIAKSLLLRS